MGCGYDLGQVTCCNEAVTPKDPAEESALNHRGSVVCVLVFEPSLWVIRTQTSNPVFLTLSVPRSRLQGLVPSLPCTLHQLFPLHRSLGVG